MTMRQYVNLLVVFVLYCVRASADDLVDHDYILTQSRATVNKVDWTGAIPAEKTAYVLVHHESEGSYEEQERLLGVRVLLKSIILTETTRDIVILVSDTTSEESVAQLKADSEGAQCSVKIVRIPAVVGVHPTCQHKYLIMHMWGMTEYERIVHVGVGTLVILNMDELFLCGHYCQLFSSWVYYSDLITVLKPSESVHEHLYSEFAINVLPNHIHHQPYTLFECEAESQEFFLAYFGSEEESVAAAASEKHLGLSRSTLFKPENGQSEAKSQRLPYKYNINAIHYYEYFHFDLYRDNGYEDLVIPGHSLGFWGEKPYRWERCLYFDLHWEYQAWREAMLVENFTFFIITRIIGLIVLHFVIVKYMPLLVTQLMTRYPTFRGSLVTKTQKILQHNFGFDFLAFGVGGPITVIIGWSVMFYGGILPGLVPPRYAWPLYIFYFNMTQYLALKTFALLYVDDKMSSMSHGNSRITVPGYRVLIVPFLTCWFVFYTMLANWHFQFGEKIFVLYMGIGLGFLTQVLMYRNFLKHLHQELVLNSSNAMLMSKTENLA